jgi:hypothetical protein
MIRKTIREQLENVRKLNEQEEETEGPEINKDISGEISAELQEGIDNIVEEFKKQVSNVAKIESINVMESDIDMKGSIIPANMFFNYSLSDGVYISGNMIELNEDTLQNIKDVKSFYSKFQSIFGNVYY